LLRNVVYVKQTTIFAQLAPKQRKLERFIRGTWFTTFQTLTLFTAISLYWAVRAPIGAWTLRLQPHQPHG